MNEDDEDLGEEVINAARSTQRNVTILHQGLCNNQWTYNYHGADWNCTVHMNNYSSVHKGLCNLQLTFQLEKVITL